MPAIDPASVMRCAGRRPKPSSIIDDHIARLTQIGAAGNDRRQKRHGTRFGHTGKCLCRYQATEALSDDNHLGTAGKTLQTVERRVRIRNPVRRAARIIRVKRVARAEIVKSKASDTASGEPLGQYPLKLAAAEPPPCPMG